MAPMSGAFFGRPSLVYAAAVLLRLILLVYGRWQDTHSAIKYTDIDYLVFTDAARFSSQGISPYLRATYRYTPLLAWLLHPTSWQVGSVPWFEFGKALFASGDIVTGWFIALVLTKQYGISVERAMRYASIWLLNPMVANISTRGSSEGLVAVTVVAMLWAVLERKVQLAGVILGFGVHFKIYPFIYAASMFWWLGPSVTDIWRMDGTLRNKVNTFVTTERLQLARESFLSFMSLNLIMYAIYGMPFAEHSYLYHFVRTDHRHNFSIYNTVLHLDSARSRTVGLEVESLAFIPQLTMAVLVIPMMLANKNLASTMLAQTLAFVTFNKVCTSQYFLWYMVFLPFYLPSSNMMRRPVLGVTALILWIVGQALWLQQGYELEFLGRSNFVPGLWMASMVFFGINCWTMGIIVGDIAATGTRACSEQEAQSKKP